MAKKIFLSKREAGKRHALSRTPQSEAFPSPKRKSVVWQAVNKWNQLPTQITGSRSQQETDSEIAALDEVDHHNRTALGGDPRGTRNTQASQRARHQEHRAMLYKAIGQRQETTSLGKCSYYQAWMVAKWSRTCSWRHGSIRFYRAERETQSRRQETSNG